MATGSTMPDGGSSAASRPSLAILLALLGVALFSVMDALVKWESAQFAVVQIVFFRSLFAFIPVALFALGQGGLGAIKANRPWGHVMRSLIGLCAMAAVFYSIANMKLADVVAITFAAPIFATALSVPMLGEHVGPWRWAAVLVGFVGILAIVRPGTSAFEPIALITVGGAMCMGMTTVFVRKLTKTESTTAIVFYFTLTTSIGAAALLPLFWREPGIVDFALLASIGLLGGAAQISKTSAARFAEVAVIVPLNYTAILWAILFGYLIWNEVPDLSTLIGAGIVAGSGLFIMFRETKIRGPSRSLRWIFRPGA